MKVLFAAAECAPFSSTGGLGEVIASLPSYLQKLGMDVRVMLPLHRGLPSYYEEKLQTVQTMEVMLGWRRHVCDIKQLDAHGVTYYFVDNSYYFDREHLYNETDDAERYAFYALAVIQALPQLSFEPDIVHCHDWHTGMISYLLKERGRRDAFYEKFRTVFTIHNASYQGLFPKSVLADLFSLSFKHFTARGLEFHGKVSYLKAGIVSADKISTVSHFYKQELLTDGLGNGLEGLLRERQHDFAGMLHGIDTERYNPVSDRHIKHPYHAEHPEKKELNKKALQHKLFLPKRHSVPIFAVVGPLIEQKGFDVLLDVCPQLLEEDVQLIIHGQGDVHYEEAFERLAHTYPDKVKVIIGYEEMMAHKIYAGADFLLIPSKMEPCGVEAMIALRYGTIPIVRETGGLQEIVKPYQAIANQGNGLLFKQWNPSAFLNTLYYGIHLFSKETEWKALVQRAMQADHSWENAAMNYQPLYLDITFRKPRSLTTYVQ